jgi:biotin transport system substrate-specific component
MQEVAQKRPLALAALPSRTALAQGLLVLGGAAFVAVMAQARVGLPFTPVPLTGQTFAVLMTGALLGSRMGAASLMTYWTAGVFGLPIFTGWAGGWAAAGGPTGGYLLGFVAAAFLVGWFAERGWDRDYRAVVPMLAGNVVIYVFGLAWLARFVGAGEVLQSGLLPFIPGDLLKLAAAASALPAGWALVRRFEAR